MVYSVLAEQLHSLSEGIRYSVTILSNASALLYQEMDRLNWAGFYLLDASGRELLLGPFQGKPACTVIPVGHGVCGTSAKENRTVLVKNVHEFPGHIACDSASNSEVVIPIRLGGKLYGVLDIDSPELERFTEKDAEGLNQFVAVLEQALSQCKK